ncbi:MAG: glycoside hydrolase family 2 protein [Opitutaceae bacterium]|nr:glycoside hydrolase family 2 protein [Opitutaceae bacterium]
MSAPHPHHLRPHPRPRLVAALALLLIGISSGLEAAPRERIRLDAGWRFQRGEAPDAGLMFEYAEAARLDKVEAGAAAAEPALEARRFDVVAANLGGQLAFVQPGFDDRDWREVWLPHDWAASMPADSKGDPARGHRIVDTASGQGVGWYRLAFDLPATDADRALALEFDGVFRDAMVWLNGRCLGRHVGGYDSFRFDLGAAARPGATNVLVVRVDATRNEGWWYEGAGIYRSVWLVRTDRVHVAPHGVYVHPRVDDGKAAVKVTTWLRNFTEAPVRVRVTTSVADASGAVLATSIARRIDIGPGRTRRVIRTVEVKDPRLWSPDDPYRYRVLTSIDDLSGTLDSVATDFGLRTIRFDPAEGLLVNGSRTPIKGVLLHQDHAGVGVALPERLARWRLERIRDMGANAIRPAHGAPAPEVIELCDQMGLMVLGEHRRPGAGAADLATLERVILRDRNHPSVIAWNLGSDEIAVQGSEAFARDVVVPMRDLARRLDPSRPVTMAMNWDWGRGVADVVDVQALSYRGNGIRGQRLAQDKQPGGFPDLDALRAARPRWPVFFAAEGGAVTTRGIYANDAGRGWFSAYDTNIPQWGDFTDLVRGNWGSTAEGWWRYVLERPWLGGAFLDSAFDHRGHPAPLAWPVTVAQTGVMDLCGFPKDTYFFYQAWWSRRPVIHLLPHWNWRGREGKTVDVWVFANTGEVELLLNGRSLGRKPMPRDSHLAWAVPFEPGVIEARGFTDGRLIGSARYETTDAPARLALTADRTEIAADGRDIAIVSVSAVDAKGRIVPTAMNGVEFEMTTGGRLLGTGNGNPASHEAEQDLRRTLFNGLAQVIVQAKDVPAPITITARSPGLVPATIVIEAVRPAAPASSP